MAFINKLTSVVVAAIAFTCVASSVIPAVPVVPGTGYPPIDFSQASKICETADANTFGVDRYGEGPSQSVRYGQCIKVAKGNDIVDHLYFCKTATCYAFSDDNCTIPALGVPIPVPVNRLGVPNAADIAQLIGQSAYCQPSRL